MIGRLWRRFIVWRANGFIAGYRVGLLDAARWHFHQAELHHAENRVAAAIWHENAGAQLKRLYSDEPRPAQS